MTSNTRNMPGAMNEPSPVAKKAPRVKHSHEMVPVDENEPSTTQTWKEGVPPEARTRSQAKALGKGTEQTLRVPGQTSGTASVEGKSEPPVDAPTQSGDAGGGLDRLGESGDRPKGQEGLNTDYESGDPEEFEDRPGDTGGDPNEGDLDRLAKASGDRSNDPKSLAPEDQSVGLTTADMKFELSTPVLNTSGASSKEIEEIIGTLTEPSDKQKSDDPIPPKSELPAIESKDKGKVEESPSTPSPRRNQVTTKNDQSDREKTSPRTFLKEKEPKTDKGKDKDIPHWRNFGKTGFIYLRKFQGVGDWTDQESRSVRIQSRKYEGLRHVNPDADYVEMADELKGELLNLDMPIAPDWDKYEYEFITRRTRERREEVVRLNVITRDTGNDSGTGLESWSRARGSRDHLTAIDKLSTINSGGQTERTRDRPMSDVRVEHTRDPNLPNILAGTNGMRLLEEKSQHRAAPSISYRTDNRREGYSRGRTHNSGNEKESGRSPRKLKIVPPLNKNERSFYDQEGSGSGGDNESDGYYRRRPNRHSDPEDPRDPGGSGGSRDPRRSGGPNGPGGPGDPGYPGGSGGRDHRRRRRDDDDSDGWDRNVKMKHPTPYNGKPDIQVYDHWMASITNYAQTMKIRERTMIGMMSAYVTGKAGDFYMNRVAGRADEWTYQTVFQAIFDHCFPKHIIRQFREQWNKLTQGKREVREYTEEIEKLARRFNEMTERTVVLKFWDGLDPELREMMIPLGIEPETHDLNIMIQTAELVETQRNERTRNRSGRKEDVKKQPKREWTRFKNRTGGNANYRPGDREEKPASNKPDRVQANAVSPQQHESKGKGVQQKRHSRAKLDSLRAEGRCFNCQETGHEQWNCPKLNSMRPPRPFIKTGAINLTKMDRLAERKEKADVYLGHISIQEPDPIAQALQELEDVEFRVHELCEEAWGEDPLWYNEETRPDCRWSVCADDQEILVWDFVNGGNRTFPRNAIDDPDFDIRDMFDKPEANRPPGAVREGGYPLIENEIYDRWEWPAINWLQARLEGQLETADKSRCNPRSPRIDVQPTMSGYSVQLDESDIIYDISHEEVLDKGFSPEDVINKLMTARSVSAVNRGDKFVDRRFTGYVMLMLGMTTLPGQKSKIKRRGTKKRVIEPEGVSAIERTSLNVKDKMRKLPEPIVIQVKINGQTIRALLDSGSMADFLSTTVVDQLRLPKEVYQKPLSVQLAVHGSRSKINCGTTVRFQYQTIDCDRRFDIANLDNYDAILGTPFLYQHQVAIGFNPSRVIVGSSEPSEMKGPEVTTITSAAADLLDEGLDQVRKRLRSEAEDLCPDTSRTALPPLRAVNHVIPLIDEKKIYRFRPSKCLEAFRDQWRRKKDAYLTTGRWRTATGHNAIPLLMIPKPSTTNGQPSLRTVFDKREQNSNTHKLASPLPDIEEILREVSRHKYRSLIDGKDAYEQIRVIPEHVSRMIFTTPDGTMESLVMQQGDCNAGATYQTLMNHVFASYLGVFVYVYLDDIIIFSDSIEDHVKHVRLVFDILRKEKLYLGPSKMQFFAEELKILGHIIDDKGISMDPHKVDKVLNWKAPTNKDLLRSFIGAVGFLAPDCKGIRIPMGHLSGMTSESRQWRWDDTAQRAFDEVKLIVGDHRDRRRKALDYSEGAPPIWVTTDGCLSGGGGYVSQGAEPETADVVGFWSGKWNPAQQNYPVHEQELLALVETLKRFRGMLHGTRFTVRTDHKGLIHLKTQKDLSHRQHRWLDIINEFDFDIDYIPGETNGFADALSRIYSDEPSGVVRADSEYVEDIDEPIRGKRQGTHPIYIDAALISLMNAEVRRSSRLADKPDVDYRETRERKARDAKGDNAPIEDGNPKLAESEVEQSDPAIKKEKSHTKITEKLVEDAEKLFRTIGTKDVSFPNCLRELYNEDPFFKPILNKPDDYSNFELRDGLVFFKTEGSVLLAIPDVKIEGRSIREAVICQGHSLLAHLGGHKTLTYLRDQVWWKTIVKDVTDYCKSCSVCATSKSSTEKPRGLLKTMPVPSHPWQYIGIDFVGPLPESSNRNGTYDTICVIIDILTAMVHLVPTRQTYKAADIAEVIFDCVYKLHGLPERIISDRDSLFTSHFWKRLNALAGIMLHMSSAFHPQTDGATERANRTMTQMLRQCVSPKQKDWVTKLPAIEFAMNSARSSTTGFTPFYLNYGRNPSLMLWKSEEVYPGVQQFAENVKDAVMSAHDAIIASRILSTNQANKKCAPATYKEGDLVYLSTKNISMPKGRARKLAPKYLGPFPITRVLKEGATYQLGVSDELTKRGINRSFHASLLRPHVPNDDRRFPGRMPIQIPGFGENPGEWIVDRIMTHHGKGTKSEFQILWKAGDRSWASYNEVAHLNALKQYCELMGVEEVAELPPNTGGERSFTLWVHGGFMVGFE
jgi:hypothetical protein